AFPAEKRDVASKLDWLYAGLISRTSPSLSTNAHPSSDAMAIILSIHNLQLDTTPTQGFEYICVSACDFHLTVRQGTTGSLEHKIGYASVGAHRHSRFLQIGRVKSPTNVASIYESVLQSNGGPFSGGTEDVDADWKALMFGLKSM